MQKLFDFALNSLRGMRGVCTAGVDCFKLLEGLVFMGICRDLLLQLVTLTDGATESSENC